MKGICKLASRVLETWVPYKTWVSKTRFLLVELDTFMPHRSRVSSLLHSISKHTKERTTNPEKEENPEERKKKEGNLVERKKEEEDPQQRRKPTTHKPSLHQAHPDRRSTI